MKKSLYRTHVTEMRVPFHDTDAMQVVWHGNYLKYFEDAMSDLFRAAGFDLRKYYEESGYVFPITRTSTRHRLPLMFNEVFTCWVGIEEYRRRIVARYEIRRKSDGALCVTGHTEQVAVRVKDFKMDLRIPEEIQAVLAGK